MKKEYILKCINGYGEITLRKFEAYNLTDARTIAKNFMKHNFLVSGKLFTKDGRIYKV